ncbi:hypothetical protein RIF29_20451 [Crotalaria pallida]|uniref:Uncharacterized protein n=1 Tax=Crotalaria pallida TaxID=3830 RepID=A0AAN9I6C3_CROPI
MDENPAHQGDNALTKVDSSFDPWMIVKHNNRRKDAPKKVELNNSDAPSTGPRFAALVNDPHVTNASELSTKAIVSAVTASALDSKYDLGPALVTKPKQSKMVPHKSTPPRHSKGHYVKPKSLPKNDAAMPSSTSPTATVDTRGNENSKQTEVEILRIMNRNHLMMVMAFISDLRARGSLSSVHHSKPPDLTEPAGAILADGATNICGDPAGCVQSIDGASVSTI